MTSFDRCADTYAAALAAYLRGAGERGLHAAHDSGRWAMEQGLGILDLTVIHHQSVDRLRVGTEESVQARAFFLESLSPFEMTHRGFRDALAAFQGVNDTMEAEARRIAHALHDEAGQSLAAACIGLETLDGTVPESLRARIESIVTTLRETAERLRRISHELRPTILDDLGLIPALQFLAEGVEARTGLRVEIEGETRGRLPLGAETTLYRVAQEAVANTIKHAQAKRVTIHVEHEESALRCWIRDDGKGFDVQGVLAQRGDRGLGLLGIRERINALGGTIAIVSEPRCGTELKIAIPTEAGHATSNPACG